MKADDLIIDCEEAGHRLNLHIVSAAAERLPPGSSPLVSGLHLLLDLWRGAIPLAVSRLLEVIGDVGDDDARATVEGEFEAQSGLVVQQPLPPVGCDELGQDDRHRRAGILVA